MTPISARWLEEGARRLRWGRLAAIVALSLAAAALAAVVAIRVGAEWPVGLALGLAAGLLTGIGVGLSFRHHPITPDLLAGHLNRTVPEAEESAQLLLADPATLPLLARLQRRRTEAALGRLEVPPPLPRGPQRRYLRAAGVMVTLAAVGGLLPGLGASAGGPPGHAPFREGSTGPAPGTLPTIRQVRVAVQPPAYTGRPIRRQEGWDVEAEEGAVVRWEVAIEGGTLGGRLVSAAGDTAVLEGADDSFTARLVASRSTLYRFLLETPDGRQGASDDHRITVRLDAPPVLTILAPEPRIAIRPGESLELPVEVLATDDFGVDSTIVVATVTKGQGEGVKFREQHLAFSSRERRDAGGVLLRRVLDLGALGLEPGDELYFHVVATDRRAPIPNEARSETVFVTVVDTSRQEFGPGAGVALNLPPDFFRSQRQLIIDTEKLLADQRGLARTVFRDRSNGLGIDQGLLRLRYGQFMGDEFEGGATASGREAHADDHPDEPPGPPAVDPITGAPVVDPFADITHEHDDPENATLLAREVKAKLRDAISVMWQAELHLRLAEPRQSLPYQQRALALLQEIRQDARSYVKRVGFDPPPLEPDRKRLTGDLSRIRAPMVGRTAPVEWSEPALRDGLAVLQRLRGGAVVQPGDVERLELAGQALGRLAVEAAPDLLESLRSLRAGIRSLAPGGARCAECLVEAERGFWRAIPDASPAAGARRDRSAGLAREYYRLLDGRR